ncbi:MAG: glutathione binding-like protein [Magnetovibrio sp.]|nr:glutathione binding-like protein [Magnetovibrio sp.]
MIDVYTWPTPNGHKVHIMLEECGLEHVIHGVNIRKGEQFEPEFLAVSPNNRIPAIVDHDGPDGTPYSLFESGAILIYLADKTGQFLAADGVERYDALQWLMFQMGNVGPMFGQAHHFRGYAAEKLDYPIERYTNESARLYRIMDKRLGESPYLGGDAYTIADIATFPWARNPQRRGQDIDELPNLKRWIEEIEARPAVEKALKVLAEHQSKPGEKIDDATREIMFGAKQFAAR